MKALKPEDCDRLMEQAIQNRDLEAAVALYEPNATFVTESGLTVAGHDAIREILRGFMQLEEMKFVGKVQSFANGEGDIAVTIGHWTAVAIDPAGNRQEIGGRNVEVVRRQPDGAWMFVVDHPRGADTAPTL